MSYVEHMHWLILCAMVIAPVGLEAEIYKWIDPQGNVIYSDKPRPGAEEIKIPKAQIYPAPPMPSASPPPTPYEQQPFTGYQRIEIASPPNDVAVRENAGNVSVTVSLTPDLQTELGHKLVLFVDGPQSFKAEGTSPQFDFTNLDRGTYVLRAAVVDSQGKEIAISKPSTFHLLRVSILTSPLRKR